MSRLTLAASLLGEGFLMARGKKLTQAEVDAWLATNRPDFEVEPGWVYETSLTPIPGRCLVEGCGADCAPRLNNMKDGGQGHCNVCGDRAMGAANRALAEAEMRRVAAERGYEVVGFFTKRYKHSKSGFEDKTYATLRCGCGNEWDASQSGLCSHGHGCGNCSPGGYKTSKPGALYLLARSDGVEERGFGISNVWEKRTKSYEPFGWRLLDVIEFEDGQVPFDLEKVIKGVVREIAGRSVAPDHYKYRNTEAFAEGKGIPMFEDVRSLILWAVASAGSRERSAA